MTTDEQTVAQIIAEKPLREALAMLARNERESGGLIRKGYAYAGPHEFVLREGTWWQAPTKPHRYLQGRPKACYGNAINNAAVYGLPYIEGYATHDFTPSLAIHHAWNIDGDGVVIDTTWGGWDKDGHLVVPIGVAYCGIEFSVERADDATWNQDATVLWDHLHDHPILREKWNGETEDTEWPPSKRLEALYAHRDGDLRRSRRLFRQMSEEVYGG